MDKEAVLPIYNGLLLSYKKEHICVSSKRWKICDFQLKLMGNFSALVFS